MGGDTFQHVQPGEPLEVSASAWNAMLDAAQAFRAGELGGPGAAPKGRPLLPCVEVLVKNMTGADQDAGAVLQITGVPTGVNPAAEPFDVRRRPAFAAYAPGGGSLASGGQDYGGRLAVLSEPLAAGDFGRAVIEGLAVTLVDLQAAYPEGIIPIPFEPGRGWADAVPGDPTSLVSRPSGPVRVLWRASGTGPQVAVVLLGGDSGPVVGRLTATVAGDSYTFPGYGSGEVQPTYRFKDPFGIMRTVDTGPPVPNVRCLLPGPVRIGTPVLLLPDRQWGGGYSFLPLQYAAAASGDLPAVGGLLSHGQQTIPGEKRFAEITFFDRTVSAAAVVSPQVTSTGASVLVPPGGTTGFNTQAHLFNGGVLFGYFHSNDPATPNVAGSWSVDPDGWAVLAALGSGLGGGGAAVLVRVNSVGAVFAGTVKATGFLYDDGAQAGLPKTGQAGDILYFTGSAWAKLSAPSTDGTYALRATVSGSSKTLSWV